jgi:hypothetical protein
VQYPRDDYGHKSRKNRKFIDKQTALNEEQTANKKDKEHHTVNQHTS